MSLVQLREVDLTRHVKTAAGAKKYGKPIGSPLGGGREKLSLKTETARSKAFHALPSEGGTKPTPKAKAPRVAPKAAAAHRRPAEMKTEAKPTAGFVQGKDMQKVVAKSKAYHAKNPRPAVAPSQHVAKPHMWQEDSRTLAIKIKSPSTSKAEKTALRIELARRASVAQAIVGKRKEISAAIAAAPTNPDGTIKNPNALFKVLYKLVPKMKEPMEQLRANKTTKTLSKHAKRVAEWNVTKATLESTVDFVVKLGASALLLHMGVITSPIG